MIFETLKERCEYYRSLTDYRLLPNSYVLMMLDGRAFKNKIKNKFAQPYSKAFRDIMDKTAEYVAARIEGAKLVHVHSDEINIVLSDFGKGTFFDNRICKLQSIAASMAAVKFSQLLLLESGEHSNYSTIEEIEEQTLVEFDCRVWNVPSKKDVIDWFEYRREDCIKGSVLALGQKYLGQDKIKGLTTKEIIDLVKKEEGIDWNLLDDSIKTGRYLVREKVEYYSEEYKSNYTRSEWVKHLEKPKFLICE